MQVLSIPHRRDFGADLFPESTEAAFTLTGVRAEHDGPDGIRVFVLEVLP